MSGSAADFIKPYNLSLNRVANLGSGVGGYEAASRMIACAATTTQPKAA